MTVLLRDPIRSGAHYRSAPDGRCPEPLLPFSCGKLALLEKGNTNWSERHHQKHVTVKPVLLRLIYRKTGIILRFWCFLVLFWCFYFASGALRKAPAFF
jgi:hypothetical protein